MSKEDDERLWNLIVLKMPLTNKELEDSLPWGCGLFLLIVLVVVIGSIIG